MFRSILSMCTSELRELIARLDCANG
jgi:hypothetical protein